MCLTVVLIVHYALRILCCADCQIHVYTAIIDCLPQFQLQLLFEKPASDLGKLAAAAVFQDVQLCWSGHCMHSMSDRHWQTLGNATAKKEDQAVKRSALRKSVLIQWYVTLCTASRALQKPHVTTCTPMYNGMMCQTLLNMTSALLCMRFIRHLCRWGMRTCLRTHSPLILCRLLCEQHVCIGLSRAVWIWVIKQVLQTDSAEHVQLFELLRCIAVLHAGRYSDSC